MQRNPEDSSFEPDWEDSTHGDVDRGCPIIDTVFATAFSVHTGTDSCINNELAVVDIAAPDDDGGNFSRYVEQEYAEDSECRMRPGTTGRWS